MRVAPEIQARIDQMVDQLKKDGSIETEAAETALRAVPRHLFLEWYFDDGKRVEVDPEDGEQLALIYSDVALVTRLTDEGIPRSSTSQPGVVARMLDALDARPGMRVLEIGAGTGYNAACIAEIVGDQALVTTLDIQSDVAEQARRLLAAAGYLDIAVRAADGFFGAPDRAPFDRIIVTVGAPDVSPHWIEQLSPTGLMVVPMGYSGWYPHLRIWRDGDQVHGRFANWTGFMPMEGAMRATPFVGRGQIVHQDDDSLMSTSIPDLGDGEYQGLWWFASLLDERLKFLGPLNGNFGFGLATDDRHWALVRGDRIVSLDAPDLGRDLELIHKRWVDLGKPKERDFFFDFVPSKDAREPRADEWMFQRKYFAQYVRVAPD